MSWFNHIIFSIGALVASLFGNNHIISNVDIATTSSQHVQIVASSPTVIDSAHSVITSVPFDTKIQLHIATSGINVSAHVQISGDINATVNCGSSDCFEKKFTTCSPATTDLSIGPTTFHYEILKPVTNGCQVSMEYTKYSNPAWINQPMVCTLNIKNNFESEISRAFSNIQNNQSTCNGPFANILRNWMNGSGGSVVNTSITTTNTSQSQLSTDTSIWQKESVDGITVPYQYRWPINLVDIVKSYGAITIAFGDFSVTAVGDAYNNCSGQMIAINSDQYCLVKSSHFPPLAPDMTSQPNMSNKTVAYQFIKHINNQYVSLVLMVDYSDSSDVSIVEPKVLSLLKQIAGTITATN